jgi:hypothetical protein
MTAENPSVVPGSSGPMVRGIVYLDNPIGRRLRKQSASISVRDVLYSAGGFRTGDPIYVAFRGADGGQYAVAIAIAACDETVLASWPFSATQSRDDSAATRIVAHQRDVQLLWPPDENGLRERD